MVDKIIEAKRMRDLMLESVILSDDKNTILIAQMKASYYTAQILWYYNQQTIQL